MIISRCDRCCIGGGALTFHPFLPPLSLSLSFSRLAYLGQCFNTPLALLYWHTPDSVWWLMSTWEPLSLFPFYFFSLLLIGPLRFSPIESLRCAQMRAWAHTHVWRQKTIHSKIYICLYLFILYSQIWSGSIKLKALIHYFHQNLQKSALLLLHWGYGKLVVFIFPNHSQTRKFVQSLAFDPHKNKSLWS